LRFEVLFVERSEAENRKGQFGYKNAALGASRFTDLPFNFGLGGWVRRQGEG